MKKTLNHPKADAEKRLLFQNRLKNYKALHRPIIYIDESGFSHDAPRTHGYSTKGQRCYGVQNWGCRGRTNVIGALQGNFLITVSLFDGVINGDTFEAWLEQDLFPKLPARSVIVLDNAAFHKRAATLKMVAQAGHTLEFLPPYSPDLNPIENKWAQAKAIRRQTNCSVIELFQSHMCNQFIGN